METIDYEGVTFHVLKGLPGYYGSADGQVLSVKRKKPLLLRALRVGGYEAYQLVPNKVKVSVTKHRIMYLARTGVPYSSIKGMSCFRQDNGQVVAVSAETLIESMRRRSKESRKKDPYKWIAEGKTMISMMERYLQSGDLNE